MTPIHWLALAIVAAAGSITASIIFFARRLKDITFNPTITVQAPIAQMPESVAATLTAINEKLSAAPQDIDAKQLQVLVDEGVALAEANKSFKGRDKFMLARNFVLDVAKGRGLSVDARALALFIESSVRQMKDRRLAK